MFKRKIPVKKTERMVRMSEDSYLYQYQYSLMITKIHIGIGIGKLVSVQHTWWECKPFLQLRFGLYQGEHYSCVHCNEMFFISAIWTTLYFSLWSRNKKVGDKNILKTLGSWQVNYCKSSHHNSDIIWQQLRIDLGQKCIAKKTLLDKCLV